MGVRVLVCMHACVCVFLLSAGLGHGPCIRSSKKLMGVSGLIEWYHNDFEMISLGNRDAGAETQYEFV